MPIDKNTSMLFDFTVFTGLIYLKCRRVTVEWREVDKIWTFCFYKCCVWVENFILPCNRVSINVLQKIEHSKHCCSNVLFYFDYCRIRNCTQMCVGGCVFSFLPFSFNSYHGQGNECAAYNYVFWLSETPVLLSIDIIIYFIWF